MKKILLLVLGLCLINCQQNKTVNNSNHNKKMLKVEINDIYYKAILNEYSERYKKISKGVLFSSFIKRGDTVLYWVGMTMQKANIEIIFRNNPYYFYDTINNHIVLFDTKIESFIMPSQLNFTCDTILNKYYTNNSSIFETWFMEYSRNDTIIRSKVLKTMPLIWQ